MIAVPIRDRSAHAIIGAATAIEALVHGAQMLSF